MAKNNQIQELRTLPVDELIKLGEGKRAQLFALKFQAAVGSLEQTHQIPVIKKEIARIELVLGEKRKAGEDTNKTIKANYNEAVAQAEKSGKEVRAKQRKMAEEMYGISSDGDDTSLNEEAIETAMKNGDNKDTEGESK